MPLHYHASTQWFSAASHVQTAKMRPIDTDVPLSLCQGHSPKKEVGTPETRLKTNILKKFSPTGYIHAVLKLSYTAFQ